jgi:hypothetical protein
VPDAEEQGPEGDDPLYDGDGDGVPDYLQDHVTARHTLDRQGYFRTKVLGHAAIAQVTPVVPPDPAGLPSDVILPFGGFSIVATGAVAPGGELLVELEFPEGVPFNSYYKYGGLPDAPQPAWYEFMYDGRSGAELDGHRVILHLVDGGRGDHDLLANGDLMDPGGPALVGTSPAPRLAVEPTGIVLDAQQDAANVTLRNVGGRPLVWAVTDELPAWLRLEPRRGELGPGEMTTLSLTSQPAGLAPGHLQQTVVIHSGGGTLELEVGMVVPFAVEGGAELTGPCVVLAWRSEPGRGYRVQFTDSLATLDWRDASEIIIAADARAVWTDCRGPADGRFYRVVQVE